MLEVLMGNIHNVVDTSGESLETIEARLEELQKQLLKKANSKQSYGKLANEVYELREKKKNGFKSESVNWKNSFRSLNSNLYSMMRDTK